MSAPQPARAIVIANIEHVASESAGLIAHSITLFSTALIGAPLSCARAEVQLALQTVDGATLAARGRGTRCVGVYYPQDKKMMAIANAVSDALTRLEPQTEDSLPEVVPRITEIPQISGSYRLGLFDRLIWWVKPTKSFPVVWGAAPGDPPPQPPMVAPGMNAPMMPN